MKILALTSVVLWGLVGAAAGLPQPVNEDSSPNLPSDSNKAPNNATCLADHCRPAWYTCEGSNKGLMFVKICDLAGTWKISAQCPCCSLGGELYEHPKGRVEASLAYCGCPHGDSESKDKHSAVVTPSSPRNGEVVEVISRGGESTTIPDFPNTQGYFKCCSDGHCVMQCVGDPPFCSVLKYCGKDGNRFGKPGCCSDGQCTCASALNDSNSPAAGVTPRDTSSAALDYRKYTLQGYKVCGKQGNVILQCVGDPPFCSVFKYCGAKGARFGVPGCCEYAECMCLGIKVDPSFIPDSISSQDEHAGSTLRKRDDRSTSSDKCCFFVWGVCFKKCANDKETSSTPNKRDPDSTSTLRCCTHSGRTCVRWCRANSDKDSTPASSKRGIAVPVGHESISSNSEDTSSFLEERDDIWLCCMVGPGGYCQKLCQRGDIWLCCMVGPGGYCQKLCRKRDIESLPPISEDISPSLDERDDTSVCCMVGPGGYCQKLCRKRDIKSLPSIAEDISSSLDERDDTSVCCMVGPGGYCQKLCRKRDIESLPSIAEDIPSFLEERDDTSVCCMVGPGGYCQKLCRKRDIESLPSISEVISPPLEERDRGGWICCMWGPGGYCQKPCKRDIANPEGLKLVASNHMERLHSRDTDRRTPISSIDEFLTAARTKCPRPNCKVGVIMCSWEKTEIVKCIWPGCWETHVTCYCNQNAPHDPFCVTKRSGKPAHAGTGPSTITQSERDLAAPLVDPIDFSSPCEGGHKNCRNGQPEVCIGGTWQPNGPPCKGARCCRKDGGCVPGCDDTPHLPSETPRPSNCPEGQRICNGAQPEMCIAGNWHPYGDPCKQARFCSEGSCKPATCGDMPPSPTPTASPKPEKCKEGEKACGDAQPQICIGSTWQPWGAPCKQARCCSAGICGNSCGDMSPEPAISLTGTTESRQSPYSECTPVTYNCTITDKGAVILFCNSQGRWYEMKVCGAHCCKIDARKSGPNGIGYCDESCRNPSNATIETRQLSPPIKYEESNCTRGTKVCKDAQPMICRNGFWLPNGPPFPPFATLSPGHAALVNNAVQRTTGLFSLAPMKEHGRYLDPVVSIAASLSNLDQHNHSVPSCTPGNYNCDTTSTSILVCNAAGQWKLSHHCGPDPCCFRGPVPGTAFCECSFSKYQSTLEVGSDLKLTANDESRGCVAGAYYCRFTDDTLHAVIVVIAESSRIIVASRDLFLERLITRGGSGLAVHSDAGGDGDQAALECNNLEGSACGSPQTCPPGEVICAAHKQVHDGSALIIRDDTSAADLAAHCQPGTFACVIFEKPPEAYIWLCDSNRRWVQAAECGPRYKDGRPCCHNGDTIGTARCTCNNQAYGYPSLDHPNIRSINFGCTAGTTRCSGATIRACGSDGLWYKVGDCKYPGRRPDPNSSPTLHPSTFLTLTTPEPHREGSYTPLIVL
ncbi:uncharacterized protein BDR25DRAFT_383695 [Lindgomyces ingoldianus]|uniref:Uncharacterized protein n=1 Tax=Lindgomyces ingoldianus TaxID=673940 RepID=A0ACB6Q968_9PLEO|nr:uncharacterized protein BDR25DRAFT_383695 [Lindgomyces ingoldianus]KAF2463425.1 hypothetical protein BDR25DRAFT_383695 [Lindgomyces ingoldianus]